MEDRYLFKGKRIDNGEWITGYLLVKKKDFYICEKPYECMDEYSSLNGQSYGFGGFKFVDPSTICQCAGLKDRNGKLIFENDIVKRVDKINIFREQPSMNCKVVWTYNYGFDTLPSCGYFDKSDGLECEVVGNIFDNPELLEVGL